MGVGRAPPGTVAQQRTTEHGVAAPASMVHEDGAARTHDDAMRVRIPPVRAPSTCDGARTPRHFFACTAHSGAGRRARVIWYSSGSNPDSPTSHPFTRAGRRFSVIHVTDILARTPGYEGTIHLLGITSGSREARRNCRSVSRRSRAVRGVRLLRFEGVRLLRFEGSDSLIGSRSLTP